MDTGASSHFILFRILGTAHLHVPSKTLRTLLVFSSALSSTQSLTQGTFLPANVSQQLDDMLSHATLKSAAAKVKRQYAQLRSWKATLLKQSAEDLTDAVAHEDLAVEIENVLAR